MYRPRAASLFFMRNSWTRAWLAALGSIVLAVVITRTRERWLLNVEQPVMDWLLDGTDTSVWDRAQILSDWRVIIPGTVLLVLVALWLEKRIAFAIITTTVFAYAVAGLIGSLVGRVGPTGELTGTFPSFEVVQAGVFYGLAVLMFWWVGAPKLLWHIVLEIATVLTLLVAIRGVVNGEFWPSDAVGAALVTGLSLITASIVLEANPAKIPARKPRRAKAAVPSAP